MSIAVLISEGEKKKITQDKRRRDKVLNKKSI